MYLYSSLDTIPYKLFIKIAATSDFSLLSDTEKDLKVLELIWEQLFKEHQEYESTPESKKEFRINRDVDALETEYSFVLNACDALAFAYDDELVLDLRAKRYQLRDDNTENYYQDLTNIKRFAKGLKIKINSLKSQLPPEEKDESKIIQHESLSIDDVMAGYTMITGFDFDYNTIPYTKFKAIKRQVNLKMKSIIDQNNSKK